MHSVSKDCLNTDVVVISRIVAAGGCLLASLTVLVAILVLHRRKAWDSLSKRLFLAYAVFTAVSAVAALGGIDYSHRSLDGSGISNGTDSCMELALALHYTGGLASMSYGAWALSFLVHVTLPVIESSPRSKLTRLLVFGKKRGTRIAIEVTIFVVIVLAPAIFTSWEPFALSDTPDYGSNGLWCDYQHQFALNCSEKVQYYNIGTFYLSTIPYTYTAVLCWILVTLVVIVLCRLQIKFRDGIVGKRILTSLPSVLFLLVSQSVILLWLMVFIAATVLTKYNQSQKSQLLWIVHATIPTLNAITLLVVSVYLHFPFRKCCSNRGSRRTENENQSNDFSSDAAGSNPASEWNHRGSPSETVYCPYEMSDCKSEENVVLISSDYRCVSYGIN